ncbi:polysaccharide deacetylase family protein [Luteococcus sp.]|uniref:polysaccharide deacetylase family protein n=1 Tax=Luteococcus sp. TaxID=1969402 RepID=UPI003735E5A1
MASPVGSPSTVRHTSASPRVSRTPTPSSTPSAPQLPTRAAIVAKYAKARPHEWGLETTGVVLRQESKHVCLTFDACGGPYGSKVDADLLAMLRKHKVKTTLFLNQRWITANPTLARELAADPLFDLQNHGTQHLPLSVSGRKGYAEQGTHNAGEVYDEVAGNIATLTRLTGRAPRFFRSGTAHMDEVAARIVRELGQVPVNFSINGDAGTTFTRSQIIQEMSAVRPGDIVIGHMNQPRNATAEGMAVAVPKLLERGITFAHLSEVL